MNEKLQLRVSVRWCMCERGGKCGYV